MSKDQLRFDMKFVTDQIKIKNSYGNIGDNYIAQVNPKSFQPSCTFCTDISFNYSRYIGTVSTELKKENYGICIYPNKDVYIGSWGNDIKNGIGAYIFNNYAFPHYIEVANFPKRKDNRTLLIKTDNPFNLNIDKDNFNKTSSDDVKDLSFTAIYSTLYSPSAIKGIKLFYKNEKEYNIYYGLLREGKMEDNNGILFQSDRKVFFGNFKDDSAMDGVVVFYQMKDCAVQFVYSKKGEVYKTENIQGYLNKKGQIEKMRRFAERNNIANVFKGVISLLDKYKNVINFQKEDFDGEFKNTFRIFANMEKDFQQLNK